MIKAVLFDLDGTLVNSLCDLADSVNFALNEMGFPTHATEKYKYFVGDGIPKMIERALPDKMKTEEINQKCFEIFMDRYKAHYFDKTVPYEGINILLQNLRTEKIKIAVISNKADEMAKKVVDKLFGNTFDAVTGKREGYPAKPDPKLTLKIIDELGLKPDECIFVGDSGMDIATARSADTLSVGVLWGFRTKEELLDNGADYLVTSPIQIYDIVKSINNE